MATLEGLKNYSNIDFTDDDDKLQLLLDSAIALVEKYTNRSMIAKTKTVHVSGELFYYGAPIISTTTSLQQCPISMGIHLYGNGSATIELGVDDTAQLTTAAYIIAYTWYENPETQSTKLPQSVQLLLNPFILDSFLS